MTNTDLERLRVEYADRRKRFANRSTYSMFDPSYLFFSQQRQRNLVDLLNKHGIHSLAGLRGLEIGCGRGRVLLEYLTLGMPAKQLYGIELQAELVVDARRNLPALGLACSDAQRLPFKSESFDLIFQYTALSSILADDIKINIAREMLRLLRRPSGLIIWFDFWVNPFNRQVRGIGSKEIRRLFPNCRYDFQRVTLAPPITRRLVRLSWLMCLLLERLKLLNTFYLVAIQPL